MFSGYKTYFVCALGVLGAIFGYLDGDLSLQAAIAAGLASLGGISLRSAISNIGKTL